MGGLSRKSFYLGSKCLSKKALYPAIFFGDYSGSALGPFPSTLDLSNSLDFCSVLPFYGFLKGKPHSWFPEETNQHTATAGFKWAIALGCVHRTCNC